MFYPIEDSQVWYYSIDDVPADWIFPSFSHPGWKDIHGCHSVPGQPSHSHFVTYFESELELVSYEISLQYDSPVCVYLNGNLIFSDVPTSPINSTLIRSGLEIQPGINSIAVELDSSMSICLHLIGNVSPDSSDCIEMVAGSVASSTHNVTAIHDYDYLTSLASTNPVQVDFFYHNTFDFCHSIYH